MLRCFTTKRLNFIAYSLEKREKIAKYRLLNKRCFTKIEQNETHQTNRPMLRFAAGLRFECEI